MFNFHFFDSSKICFVDLKSNSALLYNFVSRAGVVVVVVVLAAVVKCGWL